MTASPYLYDVYISFNQKDADAVRFIANRLREAGIKVWLFDWYDGGEEPWPSKMREALERSTSAAVILGSAGLGPQQSEEVLVNIREREIAPAGTFRVIPVLLPGADRTRLPSYLRERSWVDFRAGLDDEKAFHFLLAGILGAVDDRSGGTEQAGTAGKSEPATGGDESADESADESVSTHAAWLKNFQKGDDISAQEVVHPQGNTVSALLESPIMGRAPLSKDVRDAVSLAGMMALSAERPVDSTLLLAAILSDAPADQKHAGYSFLTALRAQRPGLKTKTTVPGVVVLLGLTDYDLAEIPSAKYSLSRRAEVAGDFNRLITRAADLARNPDSTQGTIQVGHVIGAILAPATPEEQSYAAKRLERLGYDIERLREDYLSHIEQYHAETLSSWSDLLHVGAERVGERPPDVSHDPAPEPTPPAPPAPEEEAAAEQESIQQASVSDQPSARDTLGFAPYVKAIATFLTNEKTQPPLTLSVEGEWGSGKSSFMLQLAEELRADARRRRLAILRPNMREWRRYRMLVASPLRGVRRLERLVRLRRVCAEARPFKCLTVEFNPWRHDKENALWASFALEFVRKLSRNMSWPERLRAYLKLVLRRFRWKDGWMILVRMVFLGLIIVAMSVALVHLLRAGGLPPTAEGAFGKDKAEGLFKVIQASGVAGYIAVVLFFLSKLREFVGDPFAFDLRRYVESPDYEGNIGFIEQFHEDFRKIVDTYAGGNNVYVFIDDLDRCDVPKAADLMQAINLMISGGASQLVFIIGMDREKVAAGLAVKNEKLLPYLAHRPAGPAAKDRARATDAAGAPAKPAAQSSPDIAFGLEYGYNFIEKFIQIPFRVPQPAQIGVRALLDFIAPLVEVAGEAGAQGLDGADAVARPVAGGVLVIEEFDEGGATRKTEDATQDADPARRAAQDARAVRAAAGVLREAGASIEIIDADSRQPAAKEPEEKESLMLLERGDSLTVRNIVLMVAPALDYNPRRIKQFINLFRLKAYIAYETGLFRRPRAGSPFDALTFQQLGKFVAIGLRWPRLLADLDEDYGLLQRLQQVANGEYPSAGDQAVHHWQQREELMNLLKFGCVGAQDPFDQNRPADPGRYSLDRLDVEKLLQVSPRVERAAPTAPPKARPAETETGPIPVESAGRDEAAFS